MTSKLTRDIIQSEIAEFFAGVVEIHTELGGPNSVEEAQNQLTERVLACVPAVDSEPVAWTDEAELRDVDRGGCGYLFTVNPVTPHADERRIILLYRHAQPAPVVPDDSDPRDAFEAIFPMPKHAQRCGGGYAVTSYGAWTAYEFVKKWEGWNACHAAMLNGVKS